jgi:hypothetical protein
MSGFRDYFNHEALILCLIAFLFFILGPAQVFMHYNSDPIPEIRKFLKEYAPVLGWYGPDIWFVYIFTLFNAITCSTF